jgi:ATP-dependent protease ClpP protease subunit
MDQPKTYYVNYCDSINDVKVKGIMATLAAIINHERPDIMYFLFSSSGGLVDPGISLYNFLRALPIQLIRHNTGSVDSIANVIFLAAETRYAAQHSSFLYHGVNWNFAGRTAMNRDQLSETLSSMESSESKMSAIIKERTTLTAAEVRGLFSEAEAKNASFALEKGIINEIRNPMITPNAPFYSFNLA